MQPLGLLPADAPSERLSCSKQGIAPNYLPIPTEHLAMWPKHIEACCQQCLHINSAPAMGRPALSQACRSAPACGSPACRHSCLAAPPPCSSSNRRYAGNQPRLHVNYVQWSSCAYIDPVAAGEPRSQAASPAHIVAQRQHPGRPLLEGPVMAPNLIHVGGLLQHGVSSMSRVSNFSRRGPIRSPSECVLRRRKAPARVRQVNEELHTAVRNIFLVISVKLVY